MTRQGTSIRRNTGEWLEALLVNHSMNVEGLTLDDLQDAVEGVGKAGRVLIALNNPQPARGYALLSKISLDLKEGGKEVIVAILHVLENQPREAYQTLFSTMYVQAKHLSTSPEGEKPFEIWVDPNLVSEEVLTALTRDAEPFRIAVRSEDEAREAYSLETGSPETASEAEETRGDTDTPEEEETPVEEVSEASEEVSEENTSEEKVKLYVCEVCGGEFGSPQALGSHARTHSK